MPLLTTFPTYQQPGTNSPHWDSLIDLIDKERLHEKGYDGASYYEEQKMHMLATPDEDTPWCCEYTKAAFVEAWNETKAMVEYWDWCETNTADPIAFMDWHINMLQNQN